MSNVAEALAQMGAISAAFLRDYFHGTEGRIYLAAIRNPGSEKPKGEIDKLITRDPRAVARFVATYDKPECDCAIYYTTATVRDGHMTRTANDCKQFVSLFADTDDKNHELDRDRVIELFEGLECPPTMIVNSGHGLQPHWLLDEPCEDAKRIIAARIKLHALVASDAVQDAPRFMRLPGSHNSKHGDWLPVEIVVQHPERRYALEVLEEWLDTAEVVIPSKPKPNKTNGEAKPFVLPPMDGSGTDHRRGAAWADRALEKSASELADAGGATSRHDTLRDKACRMGTMVVRGWIDVQRVRAALFAASEACGQMKEYGLGHFDKTFEAGLKHGIAMPHPDLPDNDPAQPDRLPSEPLRDEPPFADTYPESADRAPDPEGDVAVVVHGKVSTPPPASPPAADPVDLWAKFDPPTLPRGLLPNIIERFAFDQGDDMGADPAGVAMAALAVCAGATPDKVKIQVKRHNPGWLESARIWVGLVAPPSGKKSPIIHAASWPLLHLDGELAHEYSKARAIYDGLSKEEKKQTPPPKHKRLVLQDTTIEAAGEIMKDSPNGVLCHQDEMSGWYGSMDKYSSARGSAKDRAFWLQAYNGGAHSVERISRGSLYIPNLSASKLGGIQPEPIRKIAGDSVDDGLLQREITIILRPATVGKDAPQSDVVNEYRQLIARLTRLNGMTLHFDDGAQKYRHDLERRYLELQQIEAISPKLSSHIGKYEGLFARLCVLWHCIENPDPAPTVSEELARRVGKFMDDFLLPHAMAFYGGTLGLSDQHERLAAVAGYILAHKLVKLTNRDIQRGDRTMRNLDKAAIEEVFSALDTLGWITCVPGPRGALHGIVNPVVHTRFAAKGKSEAERRARERKKIAEMAAKREE